MFNIQEQCKTATMLTGENWGYLKVQQKEFEQLNPGNFEELISVVNPQKYVDTQPDI